MGMCVVNGMACSCAWHAHAYGLCTRADAYALEAAVEGYTKLEADPWALKAQVQSGKVT